MATHSLLAGFSWFSTKLILPASAAWARAEAEEAEARANEAREEEARRDREEVDMADIQLPLLQELNADLREAGRGVLSFETRPAK